MPIDYLFELQIFKYVLHCLKTNIHVNMHKIEDYSVDAHIELQNVSVDVNKSFIHTLIS